MHKALFLLAGIGSRLQPLTNTTPKPLLHVDDRPLIARSIDSLVACGITQCVVVTGHLEDQIRTFFAASYPGLAVEFIRNERYDQTNNAWSLLLAQTAFEDSGMILLDGDILYEQSIMRDMLRPEAPANALAIRVSDSLGDEEVKVVIHHDGVIQQIGKHLTPTECVGESLGIAKFDAATTGLLFQTLDYRMHTIGMANEFYEASFQQMIDQGAKIGMVNTGDAMCMEIDTVEDLEIAKYLCKCYQAA